MNFYKTEDGKVIGYLIHETINATCIMASTISNFEKGLYTNEEMIERIKSFTKHVKRINDVVDYTYTHFKNKHDEENK